MSADVYLARSHGWLHEKLLERAVLDDPVAKLVDSRRGADVIVYLAPPWPDPDAPDRLRSFRPRDLLRTYVYSQDDFPIRWAPGMYASLPAARAGSTCTGGFYVAHHHREPGGLTDDLEGARDLETDVLWSFVGTLSNDPLRERLRTIEDPRGLVQDTQRFSDEVRWGWQTTHGAEGRTAFSRYADMLGRSSFVLCPRGRGAGSIRLFETMQVGRCPVVISDDWLPPPFLDWGSCSIRVPESQVHDLPRILREREQDSAALGREARLVWERFFSTERQLQTLLRAAVNAEESLIGRIATLCTGAMGHDSPRRVLRAARTRIRRH